QHPAGNTGEPPCGREAESREVEPLAARGPVVLPARGRPAPLELEARALIAGDEAIEANTLRIPGQLDRPLRRPVELPAPRASTPRSPLFLPSSHSSSG